MKCIPWYEGLYKATKCGKIVSVKFGKERVLKPWLHKDWYHLVNLCKDWVRKMYSVHRLVAITYLDNPKNKEHINHINWVTHDNRVENLEWVTPKENIHHAIEILKKNLWVPKKEVEQYTKCWTYIDTYESIWEAYRVTWIHQANISYACNWKRNSAWGFNWKFTT